MRRIQHVLGFLFFPRVGRCFMEKKRRSTLIPDSVPSQSSNDVEIVEDESKRRMKQIPSTQMEKMYGKGFKLLQKAGFDPSKDTAKSAPIKVLLRRPREGLKDDDLTGRTALGESEGASRKSDMDTLDVEEYVKLLSLIRKYIEEEGGSAPVYRIYSRVVKPAIDHPSLATFLLVLKSYGKRESLKTVGDSASAEVVLAKPPSAGPRFEIIKCICTAPDARSVTSFSRQVDWAAHVFSRFEFSHEEYEMRLMKMSEDWGLFHCLACKRPFPDLVRVVKHCNAMGEDQHTAFGRIVIGVLLVEAVLSPQAHLLLNAIQEGDEDFSWAQIFSGLAQDALQDIPFDECLTPIALSEDELDEPEEVLEVIELEEESSASDHDMHGVINLED